MTVTINGTTGIAGTNGSAGTPAVQGEDTNTGVFFPAADTVAVATAGAERLRVDSSGNVGIGETSPTHKLEVKAANARIAAKDSGGTYFLRMVASGSFAYTGLEYKSLFTFSDDGTERARIDSSGNLLVGTTAQSGRVTIVGSAASSKPLALDSNASYAEIQSYDSAPLYLNRQGNNVIVNSGGGNLLVGTTVTPTGATGGAGFVRESASRSTLYCATTAGTSAGLINFVNPNGTVGFIATNGTATTYSTSSDYRLKENVQPMQDALDKIAQLNPVTYTWKADGSAGQGFIAHELQAVVPDCVTGEKDAVDAEGNPQYQGVDTSFLVATLVKAVQELTARVAELENK